MERELSRSGDTSSCSLRQDDGDDHAIETQSLTEDENKDHADEDGLLLSIGSNTSVTNNTNSETCCEGGETASEAWSEVLVTISVLVVDVSRFNYRKVVTILFNKMGLRRHLIPTFIIKDDSNDETIDTQDTRHDNGYDWLEDEVGLEDTHAANTYTRLGSTVGGTEV